METERWGEAGERENGAGKRVMLKKTQREQEWRGERLKEIFGVFFSDLLSYI